MWFGEDPCQIAKTRRSRKVDDEHQCLPIHCGHVSAKRVPDRRRPAAHISCRCRSGTEKLGEGLQRLCTSIRRAQGYSACRSWYASCLAVAIGASSDICVASPAQDSRKTRAAAALKQISRLGANRRIQPGGLAKGNFPSGQTEGQLARGPARPEGTLKITREASGPDGPSGGAPPPGAMARAPAKLNLSRGPRGPGNGPGGAGRRAGPNLRGRERKAGGAGGSGTAGKGPKRRERKSEDDGKKMEVEEVRPEHVLSDGMVHQLLRLQRKEWDRTPYEPKYAPGSFAANQLIHAGREFFRGEPPPVKKWGPLEKTIGVVGMYNAEAHLKVRRVTDLDDERLGERREHFESGDIEIKAKSPESKHVKAPAANAPAAVAQAAAAAEVPASKQAPIVQ